MGIFWIIVGFVLVIAAAGFTIKKLKDHKASGEHSFSKKDLITFGVTMGVIAIGGGVFTNLGFALAGNWPIDPGHYAMLFAGGILFYALMYAFFVTFYVRYWRTDLVEEQKKYNGLIMVIAPIVALFCFILAGEGMAPYLSYPLTKGFAISDKGFVLLYPGNDSVNGLAIQWYGILIVLGAILAYRISDHNFYKKYGKHGILDSIFLIAFPAGIICARIWFVVGNWNGDGHGGINFSEEVAKGNWVEIFAIWHGGLTILGGAVGGILVGSLVFIFRRKYSDLRFAFDAVVPNILLAQAIGRFGNFFNYEVYGKDAPLSSWPLVPTWVRNNLALGWSAGAPISDQMYAPMFLIEAVLNVIGFFVIAYGIPAIWKKGRALGDALGFYLLWYGTVRIIMEPMRDPNFNMGKNGQWSIWNALVYIILGAVAILVMQLIAYFRKKKGLPVEMGTPPEQLALAEEAPKEVPVSPMSSKPEPKSDFSKPKSIPHPSTKEEDKDEGAGE